MTDIWNPPRIEVSFPESVIEHLKVAAAEARFKAVKDRHDFARINGWEQVPNDFQERINAMDSVLANIENAEEAKRKAKRK